jgi:hypothetical protein
MWSYDKTEDSTSYARECAQGYGGVVRKTMRGSGRYQNCDGIEVKLLNDTVHI